MFAFTRRQMAVAALLLVAGLLVFDVVTWGGYMSVRETWYGVTPELVRNFFLGWRG